VIGTRSPGAPSPAISRVPDAPTRYLKLAAPLFVTCFSPWLAPHAVAQDVLLDFVGLHSGDDSGHAIAVADWDGDGIEDLAVAAIRDNTAAPQAGAVYVRSGKDGSVLAQFFGTNADDFFGKALVRVRDVDGDGLDELFAVDAAVNKGRPRLLVRHRPGKIATLTGAPPSSSVSPSRPSTTSPRASRGTRCRSSRSPRTRTARRS
jgi:hypothetical protein